MNSQLSPDTTLIHRIAVLNGLESLYLANHKFGSLAKEGKYEAGYREGYTDALNAIAHLLGMAPEFKTSAGKINDSAFDLPTLVQLHTVE